MTTTAAPAPQLSGTGAPAASFTCNQSLANLSYIQTDATNGRLWLCDQAATAGVWQWDHLIAPVAAATTAPIASTALLLGGCTTTTVTIAGAAVGVNAAIASPIGQPTSIAATSGLLNTTAWVSSANTVTVSVCGLASLTTAAIPYRVLLF